jgi:hypothetical protein
MGPRALSVSQSGVKSSEIITPANLYEALEVVSNSGVSREESQIQRGVIAAEANRDAAIHGREKLVQLREQATAAIANGTADNLRGRELLKNIDTEIAKLDRQIEKHAAEIDGLHAEQIVDVNGKFADRADANLYPESSFEAHNKNYQIRQVIQYRGEDVVVTDTKTIYEDAGFNGEDYDPSRTDKVTVRRATDREKAMWDAFKSDRKVTWEAAELMVDNGIDGERVCPEFG